MTSHSLPQRTQLELLHGQASHADPVACVEDVSAELAVRQVVGFPHSIAGLVFHMNYWMNYELQRIRGKRPEFPEHAAESWPAPATEIDAAHWDRLRNNFERLIQEYEQTVKSPPQELERQVESIREGDKKHAGSVEAVLWQMIVHNSYHVGQVAMIRRI